MFLEKFGLLNLLKAIDGLKSAPTAEKEPSAPADNPPQESVQAQNADLPNFMYETLVRHEQMSNRLHNKKYK